MRWFALHLELCTLELPAFIFRTAFCVCVLYLCCFFGLAEFETCEWECAVCCRLGILSLKLADYGNLLTLNRERRIVKREQ